MLDENFEVDLKRPEFPRVSDIEISEASWNWVESCTQLLRDKNVLTLLKKAQDLYRVEGVVRCQMENPFLNVADGR